MGLWDHSRFKLEHPSFFTCLVFICSYSLLLFVFFLSVALFSFSLRGYVFLFLMQMMTPLRQASWFQLSAFYKVWEAFFRLSVCVLSQPIIKPVTEGASLAVFYKDFDASLFIHSTHFWKPTDKIIALDKLNLAAFKRMIQCLLQQHIYWKDDSQVQSARDSASSALWRGQAAQTQLHGESLFCSADCCDWLRLSCWLRSMLQN